MTEFWDKPAEKSGKVLAAFLEGLPLVGCPFSGTECIKYENEYRLIIDIDKVISSMWFNG